MHLRLSFRVLAILICMLSVSMAFPLIWILIEKFTNGGPDKYVIQALGLAIILGLLLALVLYFLGSRNLKSLGRREAFFIVSFAWFIGAGIGALPFYLWAILSGNLSHDFGSYINCYFEAMSGLTTTGASILSNIPAVPKGLLLWRAFIQWLGGLGIVVLFVAVMPILASANKKIFQAETSNIGKNQDTPSLQDMAQVLWLIYGTLTLLQIVFMKLVDPSLDWFTCITFGFSTSATAGFSIFNESSGSINIAAQWIVVLFMFLAGVNYSLFYHLIKGKPSVFFKNVEFKYYILVVVFATIIIAYSISGTSYHSMAGDIVQNNSSIATVLDSAFQVVSLHTTTGFSNANSNDWPDLAKFVLILLMFVGGCSGSTGGGIKVIRFVALFRMLAAELERAFRPGVVRPCVVGGSALSSNQKHTILSHILFVVGLAVVCSILLFLMEGSKLDLITAFTASIASINNIGPGFSLVGVTENYSWFSPTSKLLLSFLMAVGRLEVFTVLALLSRRFWRF